MSLSVRSAAARFLKPVPWIVVLGLSSVYKCELRPVRDDDVDDLLGFARGS